MSRASIWRAWSLVITAAIVAAIGILAVAAVRAQSDSTHPTNLTGEIESSGVVLQWHAPQTDAGSVTGYEILRRRPLQGETVLQILVADTGSSDTTYTDTSATTPGEGYVYRVKAWRGTARSRHSNFVRLDIPGTLPTSTPVPTPTATPQTTVGLTAIFPASRFQSSRHLGDDDRPQVIISFSDAVERFSTTSPSIVVTGASIRSLYGHTEAGLENAWIFFLDPDGDTDVQFRLLPNQSCASGGICTSDGQLLSAGISRTLPGPAPQIPTVPPSTPTTPSNNSATGQLLIIGSPHQVRQSLTAAAIGITDADGLTTATYAYQWVRTSGAVDIAIANATAQTYTLQDGDAGQVVKVRVSFTDDRGNHETLTSTPTGTVLPAVATEPRGLVVLALTGALFATCQVPISDGGAAVSGYRVQWKPTYESWETSSSVSEANTSHTITGVTAGTLYAVRVIATNDAGDSPPSREATGTPSTDPTAGVLPKIIGTAISGQALSVDTQGIKDGYSLTNPSFSYQWVKNDWDRSANIGGATASTYTPFGNDLGKIISVKVTFTDNSGSSKTLTSQPTQPVVSKPNVIVILVDDLGYGDVSYNGATDILTPNIDRLASRGVVFANGYVTYPTCTPSRAGLLTGRYPSRFGLEGNLTYAPNDNHHGLPIDETLFPDLMQYQGYETAVIGKWQLGAAPIFNPLNRGFDYFFGFLGGSHDYWEYDTSRPDSHQLMPLVENRKVADFDGYLTDVLTDRSVDFIKEQGSDPFMLYLAYNAPHGPLQAPQSLIDKYAHVTDTDRRVYLAMVDSLDQNVGRLLDILDDLSIADNTMVFFLSDNGGSEVGDNGPFRLGKDSFHEGGVHVPFIGSWPARWPQGETYEPMVISMDIAATALQVAGVRQTPKPLDGVNLDPFMRGQYDGEPHEALFWRHWRTGGYSVIAENMKLIKDRRPVGKSQAVLDTGQDPKLLNLEADADESDNLFDQDRPTAAKLAGLWNAWNAQNGIGNYFYGITAYDEVREQSALWVFIKWYHDATHHPDYNITIGLVSSE